MLSKDSFVVLDVVDSTNNYAMAQIHAGLAKDGIAYYAKLQTHGKGQMGRKWESEAKKNITLTIPFFMDKLKIEHQFVFSMAISIAVSRFFTGYVGEGTRIKWPNDIYWRDRKAGGILIENIITERKWKWAVVGIGINVNQLEFDPILRNPISLQLINQRAYPVETLARELHTELKDAVSRFKNSPPATILESYNNLLFKKEEKVKLKKGAIVFETTVKKVDAFGVLHTRDVMDRTFQFGEVEWVL